MARVTVEDCVLRVPNRFELIMLASRRGRAISAGEAIEVARDNDKNPVVALREIGDGKIDLDELRTLVIHGLQKHVEVDEPEEDNMAALMSGQEWSEAVAPAGNAEIDGVDAVSAEPGEEMGGAAKGEAPPPDGEVSPEDGEKK